MRRHDERSHDTVKKTWNRDGKLKSFTVPDSRDEPCPYCQKQNLPFSDDCVKCVMWSRLSYGAARFMANKMGFHHVNLRRPKSRLIQDVRGIKHDDTD